MSAHIRSSIYNKVSHISKKILSELSSRHHFLVRLLLRADPEGETGGPDPPPPPWKITQLQGYLAMLGRIPWKIAKLLISQYPMLLAHYWPARERAFNRFAGSSTRF